MPWIATLALLTLLFGACSPGTGVSEFASPLPIVILDNFGAGPVPRKSGNQQVARQLAQMVIIEPNGTTSTLADAATMTSRVGIRVRGRTSADYVRKSYSLETWGDRGNDVDTPLLGMPSESDWVLYAPSWWPSHPEWPMDNTLLHNSFIYELSRQTGNYAPRFCFVELFLNTDGGVVSDSDYQGLYLLVEKIKRAPGRVDFEPLSRGGTQGGWMVTVDAMDPIPIGGGTPQFFHTAGPNRVLETPADSRAPVGDDLPALDNKPFNFDSPRGDEITPGQRNAIVSWFNEFNDALYGPDFTDPLIGYRAYIDVESFVDHILLNNIALNKDALALSTFMYRPDENSKLHLGPIWDFDWAYDSNTYEAGKLDYGHDRLWAPRLFEDPYFAQAYQDRYVELRKGPLSDENVLALIDAQAAEITPEVATRTAIIDARGRFRRMPKSWEDQLDAMKNWLISRLAALDAQYVPTPEFGSDGGDSSSPTSALFTAREVE